MQYKWNFMTTGLAIALPMALIGAASLGGCSGASSGGTPLPTSTPVPTPGPSPTPTLPGPLIVYQSNLGFNVDLYLLPTTGAPARLTSSPANDIQPSLAPNQQLAAFSSTRDGNPEIYTINLATRATDRLTEDSGLTTPVDDQPVFSANSQQIAWRSTRGQTAAGLTDIYTMQFTGASQTRLTTEPNGASDPFWHPDGTRVGYVTTRGNAPRIVIRTIGSNAEQVLSPAVTSISHPRFSRDGSRIVFSQGGSAAASSQLFIINADGSTLVPGPTAGSRNFDPGWSLDGTRIIWSASGGSGPATPQIFSALAAGGAPQRLTNSTDTEVSPSAGG